MQPDKYHLTIPTWRPETAQAVVGLIDNDPQRQGLARTRATRERWLRDDYGRPEYRGMARLSPAAWADIRDVLLEPSWREFDAVPEVPSQGCFLSNNGGETTGGFLDEPAAD